MTGDLEARLLERLRDGPALAVDLADALGRSVAFAEALLRDLARRGLVRHEATALGVFVWRLLDEGP